VIVTIVYARPFLQVVCDWAFERTRKEFCLNAGFNAFDDFEVLHFDRPNNLYCRVQMVNL